jgi:hypothetical protein
MILGICIKNEETYNYSKALFLDSTNDKYFIAQSIRDIDFSIIVKSMDNLKIYIIEYPKNDFYKKCNIDNINPERSNIKILGNYSFRFEPDQNNVDEINNKKNIVIPLDKEYELNIDMSYILYNSDYILTTPYISGNKSYLLK